MEISTKIYFISPGSGKVYKQVITQTIDDTTYVLVGIESSTTQTTLP